MISGGRCGHTFQLDANQVRVSIKKFEKKGSDSNLSELCFALSHIFKLVETLFDEFSSSFVSVPQDRIVVSVCLKRDAMSFGGPLPG